MRLFVIEVVLVLVGILVSGFVHSTNSLNKRRLRLNNLSRDRSQLSRMMLNSCTVNYCSIHAVSFCKTIVSMIGESMGSYVMLCLI